MVAVARRVRPWRITINTVFTTDVHLDQAGIRLSRSNFTLQVGWETICKVNHVGRFLCLAYDPIGLIWLPASQVPQDAMEFLNKEVLDHGGKVS
jgi:hypothetical protein